jgi:hypothetical protein
MHKIEVDRNCKLVEYHAMLIWRIMMNFRTWLADVKTVAGAAAVAAAHVAAAATAAAAAAYMLARNM